jgi:hypothetical protein
MISIEPELIWQGRLQIGDEPGTYGDAAYVGLCTELPATIANSGSNDPDTITFALEAEDVKVFAGYPGHEVTVFFYQETSTPYHWKETPLFSLRMKENRLDIPVDMSKIKPQKPSRPVWISFRIEVDTTVAPGLFNDFVLTRFSLKSQGYKYTANFGFQYSA